MPRKYEVIDELIRDELREFILWLQMKEIEFCLLEDDYVVDEMLGEVGLYQPIHKAAEDLINEYMEIE